MTTFFVQSPALRVMREMATARQSGVRFFHIPSNVLEDSDGYTVQVIVLGLQADDFVINLKTKL